MFVALLIFTECFTRNFITSELNSDPLLHQTFLGYLSTLLSCKSTLIMQRLQSFAFFVITLYLDIKTSPVKNYLYQSPSKILQRK